MCHKTHSLSFQSHLWTQSKHKSIGSRSLGFLSATKATPNQQSTDGAHVSARFQILQGPKAQLNYTTQGPEKTNALKWVERHCNLSGQHIALSLLVYKYFYSSII